MKLTKNQKILIGVGVLAGLLFLSPQGDDQAYAGGTGGFGGGFGGEGLAGLTGDVGGDGSAAPAGYTFNFPSLDTSPIVKFIDNTPAHTEPEPSKPKKESAVIPSGGRTSSLDQIFGTPSQRVNKALGINLLNQIGNHLSEYTNEEKAPSGGSQAVTESLQQSKKEASAQAAGAIAESGYGKTLFSPIKSSSSSKSSTVVKKAASEPAKKSWSLAEVKAGKNRRR